MTAIKKYEILSGSALKLIAVITMLIDHIAAFLMPYHPIPLVTVSGHTLTLYYLMRWIGRAAFPIFCFLLVEGFIHTRSRLQYGFNLLVFAAISEIPWDLIHSDTLLDLRTQSVYVTLLLGYCGLCAIDRFHDQPLKELLLLGLLFFGSAYASCDYSCRGFALILILYLLREYKVEKTVIGCCVIGGNFQSPMGFLPLFLYNGKRGFIRGNVAKYAFYAFYPAHIFVLYLLRRSMG